MPEPRVPKRAPILLKSKPATPTLVRLRPKRQPAVCDGSHKGGEFTPVKYEATETKTVYFCGCKHTATPFSAMAATPNFSFLRILLSLKRGEHAYQIHRPHPLLFESRCYVSWL